MNDKRDELRTKLLDITPEQMQEYFTFGVKLTDFMYQMRLRFLDEMLAGKTGWDTASPHNLLYRMDRQMTRKPHDSIQSSIDIANLAFMHWYSLNRDGQKTESDGTKLVEAKTSGDDTESTAVKSSD